MFLPFPSLGSLGQPLPLPPRLLEDRLPAPARGGCVDAWRAACEARLRRRQHGLAWTTQPGTTATGAPDALGPGGRPREVEAECWAESPEAVAEIARCERAVRGRRPAPRWTQLETRLDEDALARMGVGGLGGYAEDYAAQVATARAAFHAEQAADRRRTEEGIRNLERDLTAARARGDTTHEAALLATISTLRYQLQQPMGTTGYTFRPPTPALPASAADCAPYASLYCQAEVQQRGTSANPCDPAAVAARCASLVRGRTEGSLTAYQAAVGAAHVNTPAGDVAQRFLADAPPEAQQVLLMAPGVAEALATPSGGGSRWTLYAGAAALSLLLGVWWWRRRGRGGRAAQE